MCETRREVRVSRINHAKTRGDDDRVHGEPDAVERPRRVARAPRPAAVAETGDEPTRVATQHPARRVQRDQIPVRTFGVVNNNGEEWMLVRRQSTDDSRAHAGGRGSGRGGVRGGRGQDQGRGGRGGGGRGSYARALYSQ